MKASVGEILAVAVTVVLDLLSRELQELDNGWRVCSGGEWRVCACARQRLT